MVPGLQDKLQFSVSSFHYLVHDGNVGAGENIPFMKVQEQGFSVSAIYAPILNF